MTTPTDLSQTPDDALTTRLVDAVRALDEALHSSPGAAPPDVEGELLAIGEELSRRGGFRAMLAAYETVRAECGARAPATRRLDELWQKVGNWLA